MKSCIILLRRSQIWLLAAMFIAVSACKTQNLPSVNPETTTVTKAENPATTEQKALYYEEAVAWAEAHSAELIEKYMSTAGKKLDPDEMRLLFTPIGYDGGTYTVKYRDAEKVLVDKLYAAMLKKAIDAGNTKIVIFTGPSASGKSTATKNMDFSDTGLIYDAAFNSYKKLATAIERAEEAGMKQVTVIAVYNTIRNCFRNSIDRGKVSNRFIHVPYMIESFMNNKHKYELLVENHPEVELIALDKSDNQIARRVTAEDAMKWNFDVSQEDINVLFGYIKDEIDKGELKPNQLAAIAGDILSVEGLGDANLALAKEIDRRIREISR